LLLVDASEGGRGKDIRIILIGTLVLDVMLIIHVLDVLLGVVLGLLAINEVHALSLGELVNLSACESDEEFLGELVRNWLAYFLSASSPIVKWDDKGAHPPCVDCPRRP
jgi:hypothetical protein